MSAHCKGERGDMQVQLCYRPTDSKLTVMVVKCKNLEAKDINGYSDPYVKIQLLHGAKKLDKKKTSVREKTLNPIYNESFNFTLTNEKIKQASVVLAVHDYDKLGRNEFLGQVHLGLKRGASEDKHWSDMMSRVGQPVSEWHTLQEEDE